MADVTKVVNRHATNIELYFAWLNGLECFFTARQGVKNMQHIKAWDFGLFLLLIQCLFCGDFNEITFITVLFEAIS
jgi:hypothetical protein